MLVRKIRNAEAAAKIERRERTANSFDDTARDFEAVGILAHENRVIENLRADIKMHPANLDRVGSKQRIENRIDRLFIYSKSGGLAAHAHGAALDFGRRIHAYRNARAFAEAAADGDHTRRFARRFDVNLSDSARENELESPSLFSPARRKRYPLGRAAGGESLMEFSCDAISSPAPFSRKYSRNARFGFAFTE